MVFSLMSFRPIQYVRYEIKLCPVFIAQLIFYKRMLLYLLIGHGLFLLFYR